MATSYKPRRGGPRNARADRIARGLGWFGLGMGLAQIFAPRVVCRLVGLPPAPTLTRLCGVRQFASGIVILTQSQRAPWLNGRIAGDLLDLAGLAVAAAAVSSANGRRISVSMAAVAGITALDVYCSRELTEQRKPSPKHVHATIAVDRPPEELYRFWRDLRNLPTVMPHLKSVEVLDGNRSRWSARGRRGGVIVWDSELIDDRPNERLAWRSLEQSRVYNAGSVQFAPIAGARGTRVSVELLYDPPPGTLGASLAKLVGKDPGNEIRADLDAFKRLMESPQGAPTRLGSGERRNTNS